MIKRVVQGEIASLMEEFPAEGILGSRQVGKTTLAKEISTSLLLNPSILIWKVRQTRQN